MAGPAKRTALWMGAVCDAMDAASAWTAGAEGKDVRWVRVASSLPVVFSLGGVVTGIRWPASRRDHQTKTLERPIV
ncbi:hypothetical protein NJB14197_24900 [Mycobacterium montefiorense]|uniref:hypothetical protein n=1 Tax=Mycobacterium montefiorense TaxID=154654 RepID=UPI0021C46B44|nr:hypothetical protein [Mycobacterium montefiorense]GKU34797.1 hypothetical protein NJB14191_21430 [Mycobacterium montefiorense]GKU40811.1 hypothetical protein NJB14192_27970 [Mycobacterium montefiorense]GKU56630.1 hypothetical protein NJB14197_24900 [Mycobacterium montefiorense]GKU62261.1 hypothetical protein NJB18182_27620 [Mycobacterium montefiorense]